MTCVSLEFDAPSLPDQSGVERVSVDFGGDLFGETTDWTYDVSCPNGESY